MPLNIKKAPQSTADATPNHEATPKVEEKKKGKKDAAPAGGKIGLDAILAAARKEKGTDLIAIKARQVPDVERVPTGVFEFDAAVGGGFPKGRISIVFGVESSGKTNLLLKAIAYVQRYFPKERNRVVFVNLEGTFDPTWAAQFGIDVDQLDIINPAYGEEAVDMVDACLRADDVALVVVDSIAVLISAKEVAASVEKADVGTSAVLAKRMCNKAVIALAERAREGHHPALVLINQRRFKIGVMFGDPETMPGGETVKFLSSLTVRMYGKNIVDKAIHPTVPAWKETNVTIRKAKVPVCAASFKYDMAMMPAGDIEVGDTDSWGTVSGHLKSGNFLYKGGDGWVLALPGQPQETYKTLVPLHEQYVCDLGFRVKCQQAAIKLISANKFTISDEKGAALPTADGEPGGPDESGVVAAILGKAKDNAAAKAAEEGEAA